MVGGAPTPDHAEPASWNEDRVLMAAVADGDTVARRELALRLLPRVKRTVRAVLGQHEDLDDAVQICLMEVLRAAPGYRGDSSVETWARRIVVRRAMRFARRQRMRLVVDADSDPTDLSVPEEQMRLRERLPRPLDVYLDDLPEIHRVALVLRHGFGYSLREIADMTGTSANTIKMRLFHGLKKLRKLIDRDLQKMGKERRR
jgi:RNA polymerase sigma-70 factor (ECF subfamily)